MQAHSLLSMIHPATPEELLTIITEYERVNAASGAEIEKPPSYEDMSDEQQDVVDNIVNELDTSVEIAVEAVLHLGENDARDIGV